MLEYLTQQLVLIWFGLACGQDSATLPAKQGSLGRPVDRKNNLVDMIIDRALKGSFLQGTELDDMTLAKRRHVVMPQQTSSFSVPSSMLIPRSSAILHRSQTTPGASWSTPNRAATAHAMLVQREMPIAVHAGKGFGPKRESKPEELDLPDPETAEEAVEQGLKLYAAGNVKRALTVFLKASLLEDFNTLEKRATYYNIACCYSKLGQTRQGLKALRDCLDAGFEDWETLLADDDLQPLRDDSIFEKLLEYYKVGFFGKLFRPYDLEDEAPSKASAKVDESTSGEPKTKSEAGKRIQELKAQLASSRNQKPKS
eukprot:gnl/MRDRNA2_/MRDRNA2_73891_c0_seq1.p1 gnl/MRDRNA2_/MRDRNA2_73891_c0~~gnl/MRDRNA2_/MRDRNA2_73891_c0_seq1.p1  ORF type:complete len:313 (+),score=59.96 gnl/MRDRNA2_/MRDRNA2_73891_c0_seq1:82-1020(+)